MEPAPSIAFGPFRLALAPPQASLWRGAQILPLRARSLAVLRYLLEHPDRLVTKAELRQHVWAGMQVTDTVLRVCIRDIRATLDDTAGGLHYACRWMPYRLSLRVGGDIGRPELP